MAPSIAEVPVAVLDPAVASTKGSTDTTECHGRLENPPQVQSMGRTKDGRLLKIREYPKFNSLEEHRLYRKQHLACAFRIFAERGYDEGVAGHISVRDPIMTDHFCTLTPMRLKA